MTANDFYQGKKECGDWQYEPQRLGAKNLYTFAINNCVTLIHAKHKYWVQRMSRIC